jgi:non-ribosomal peptide synthetase-like protein
MIPATKNVIMTSETTCLPDIFESQVDQNPNALALICQDGGLTYQEVEDRANQLAHLLRDQGVGPEYLVGLHVHRSARSIIAILAVLKTGAGYVPLDPCFPPERCRHIVAEAHIKVLLSEESLSASAGQFFSGHLILLDTHQTHVQTYPTCRLTREDTGLQASNLCYVLYTSGTTGRPKGVMTEHRNVVRFIQAFRDTCKLTSEDRIYHGFALGFDGSVEEMWMAFSNGASLFVGTDDIVKVSSEVARFINDHRITFFSTVPTFLSMIQEDLPTVRVLIVSGEVCSQALAERWARPGRRMLNVYGPTEATVNTTVAECRAGTPVTIGRPLPGYELFILNEHQKIVPSGQWGELYIGGAILARGYLCQPELTFQHFIENPLEGEGDLDVLYRTGDRVRWNENGDLEFQGRIDSQVKVRGFRIELAEIENVLKEHPMIDQAVTTVATWLGLQQLAAYVVLSNGSPINRSDVLKYLQRRLPAYMIPATLDVIDTVPTLNSGKADREQLPEPATALVPEDREIVAPQNEIQRRLQVIWQEVFNIPVISIRDDFFMDLGGHSLLAARMVSTVRQQLKETVALRDVYRFPTIEQLAAQFSESPISDAMNLSVDSVTSSQSVFHAIPRGIRWLSVTLQTISLYGLYAWASVPMALGMLIWIAVYQEALPLQWAIWMSVALALVHYPLGLLLVVLVKWLIIGRYKPGRHPVGGFYYWRWWLVHRLQSISRVDALAGTPLMPLFYRLMGAKVGCNCLIDTPHCCCFDLVRIGNDTGINAETQLLGYRIENGELIFGSVEIGKHCFVGIHSALGLNTRMEDDSRLDDLSLLDDGQTIPTGQGRKGSPAQPDAVRMPEIPNPTASRLCSLAFGLLHLLSLDILWGVLLLGFLPSLMAAYGGWMWRGLPGSVLGALLAIPLDVVFYCLWVALLKRIIMHQTPPGTHCVYSLFYLRKWLADTLMRISRQTLHALYTTIYLPPWLRLLGARIGKHAEISTVSQVTPDLIDIADESFFADGSMIGGRHFYRGHVHCDINRIGRRSFVGNNAILPVGRYLGDECLLGVLSTPPAEHSTTPHGTDWLGSPAFQLPHRQKVGGFDESVTFKPTPKLYAQRLFIDGLRVLLPAWLAGLGGILFYLFCWYTYGRLTWPVILSLSPVVGLLIAVSIALAVIGLKWCMMGHMEPVIKPLWSTYVWWNEAVNGLHETIAVPMLLPLVGTPYLAWYLRGLGCKIGKHTFLGTTLFSEFDLVHIGDYVALNEHVVIQNHLFEDRIMKSSHVHIADNCSVGNMAIVLYDTDVQAETCIAPLSLLMKGETLARGTRWYGIPTRPKQG